jgi:hypothetical protein
MFIFISFVLVNSGCVVNEKSTSTEVKKSELNSEDLTKIDDMIEEFVILMYSTKVEENYSKSVNGEIDDEIKEFISKNTIEESENNAELPVHYPRFVEVNGFTTINYEISKSNDKEEIVINKISDSNDNYFYYVKVNLKAGVISKESFSKNYIRNDKDGSYSKSPKAEEIEKEDTIKIQAKFDIKIIKEDKKFKIEKFTEVDSKPQTKNRLLISNNDFIERILFLNTEDSEEGEIKADEDDLKIYKKDSEAIEDFFKKIKELDSIRTNLMETEWEKDKNSFAKFLEYIDLNDGKEIDLGDEKEYKENFSIDSFPLRFGMEEIKSIDKDGTIVHLSYTENNHVYVTKFTANIEEDDGITSNPNKYSYEYLVWINDENMITKMKLNDIYKVIKEEE